ncbi:hypothetical protein SAMD00019534_013700, partial [Acytostelium subglobosum LB1]|uniref:hypothetical protein n=1 Tax=Acytostelium subglobosum LB1 TaxID=1410327 RepID=UPI000644F7A9
MYHQQHVQLLLQLFVFLMITVTITVNGQDMITTVTIYVDQTSTNTSTICGLDYQDPNMACPNITSAINSYRSLYQQQQQQQPLQNSALSIAMAGGVYPALKGNSNLELLNLNVTIGPSPFTQGDVTIDLAQNATSNYLYFFNLTSQSLCNPPMSITLNSLTFTNGTQVINSLVNNINIVLNNVTFYGVAINGTNVINVAPFPTPCTGSPGPSLTINGGRMVNCQSKVKSGVMLQTECALTLNQTEFIGNSAFTLWSHYEQPVSIVDTSFIENMVDTLMSTKALASTTPLSIVNASFIGNMGSGDTFMSMLSLTGGLININNTLFDTNDNFGVLLLIKGDMYNSNVTIADTTFTNSALSRRQSTNGNSLVSISYTNLTMDRCTFVNNNVPKSELAISQSTSTLNNLEFGSVSGLDGGAIRCQSGHLTMNNIINHIGSRIFDCHASQRCSLDGNLQVCQLSGGAIAGIVIGTVAGVIIFIVITYIVIKKRKMRNQYLTIQ